MTSPIIQRNAPTKNDQPHPIPKKNAGRWPNQVNTVSKEILSSEQKNEAKIEQNIESIDHKILSEILDQLLTIFPQKNEELNTITSDTKVLNDFVLGKLKKIKGLKELFQKNLKKLEELKETNQKVESDNKNIKNIIEEIKNVVIEYIERDYPLDGKNQEEIADLIVEKLDCSAKTISKIAQLLNIDIVKIVSTPIISIEKKEEIHTEIDLTKSIILDDYLDESKVDEKKEEIIKINVVEKITSINEKKDSIKILLKSLQLEGKKIKEIFDSLKNEVMEQINRINSDRVELETKLQISKALPDKCRKSFTALNSYKIKLDENIFQILSFINHYSISNLSEDTLRMLEKTHEDFALNKTSIAIQLHRSNIDEHITELHILLLNYFELINIYLDLKYLITSNEIKYEEKFYLVEDFDKLLNKLWQEEDFNSNLFNIEPFFGNITLEPIIYQEIIYSIITKYFNNILLDLETNHNSNNITRRGWGKSQIDLKVLYPFYNDAKLNLKFSEIKWNCIKKYLGSIKTNLAKEVATVTESLVSPMDPSIEKYAISLRIPKEVIKKDLILSSERHSKNCQELTRLNNDLKKFESEAKTAKKNFNRTYDTIVRCGGKYPTETNYNLSGIDDEDLNNNVFNAETLDVTK